MLARVDAMYRRWELERSEGSVIVEAAYHWLRANIDCLDDKSVLTHGDYSLRNILLDGDRISGILDWELCCVSHPAEDLAYIRSWVEPAMPWQEYLDAYRAHSGYDVTSEALWYYSVWVRFWNLVIGAAAYSGYHLNKHRNFVYASVACVEYRESLDCLARLIADSPRR
jgi:aminoglycoside phosphotransferase (APT) family kinase protein